VIAFARDMTEARAVQMHAWNAPWQSFQAASPYHIRALDRHPGLKLVQVHPALIEALRDALCQHGFDRGGFDRFDLLGESDAKTREAGSIGPLCWFPDPRSN
jgi:hypothetical protein